MLIAAGVGQGAKNELYSMNDIDELMMFEADISDVQRWVEHRETIYSQTKFCKASFRKLKRS